jgi:hypothetical protein
MKENPTIHELEKMIRELTGWHGTLACVSREPALHEYKFRVGQPMVDPPVVERTEADRRETIYELYQQRRAKFEKKS